MYRLHTLLNSRKLYSKIILIPHIKLNLIILKCPSGARFIFFAWINPVLLFSHLTIVFFPSLFPPFLPLIFHLVCCVSYMVWVYFLLQLLRWVPVSTAYIQTGAAQFHLKGTSLDSNLRGSFYVMNLSLCHMYCELPLVYELSFSFLLVSSGKCSIF